MRNVFMSVAISVLGGMSLPLDALAAEESSSSSDPVVVEKVKGLRFRLVNNSEETLTYMQWINQSSYPVAYCKYEDEKVSICSRDRYLDSKGRPALQEARLKPGKSVMFDAMKNKAVAVGVLLQIEGQERILWCDCEL